MSRSLTLFGLSVVVLLFSPTPASAHSPGAMLVSWAAVIVIASLLSGIGKIVMLDHFGEPGRPIGRLVLLTTGIEFVLITAAFACAISLMKTSGALFLLACAAEISLAVLINWLVLVRSAKPPLSFWLACALSLTLPVTLSGLYAVGLGPMIYGALGG